MLTALLRNVRWGAPVFCNPSDTRGSQTTASHFMHLRHPPVLGLLTAVVVAFCASVSPLHGGTLDTDGDGIPNLVDPDVDNDGVPNAYDRNVDGGVARSGPFRGKWVGDRLGNGS